jgi:hypothetical protein
MAESKSFTVLNNFLVQNNITPLKYEEDYDEEIDYVKTLTNLKDFLKLYPNYPTTNKDLLNRMIEDSLFSPIQSTITKMLDNYSYDNWDYAFTVHFQDYREWSGSKWNIGKPNISIIYCDYNIPKIEWIVERTNIYNIPFATGKVLFKFNYEEYPKTLDEEQEETFAIHRSIVITDPTITKLFPILTEWIDKDDVFNGLYKKSKFNLHHSDRYYISKERN